MLDNLKAEMTRFSLTARDVARVAEVSYDTAINKLSGKREFTRREMFLIKNTLFPFATIDYLFAYEPITQCTPSVPEEIVSSPQPIVT